MSPSEAIVKVWWSMISWPVAVEARGEHALGERQADARRDALAERAGRRLDARGRAPYSGWPAHGEPSWRKFSRSDELEAVAAEVERSSRAASRRARRRARSGRGSATPRSPGCGASRACRACRRAAPAPSACPGAPSSAFCTASIASVRIVLMTSSSTSMSVRPALRSSGFSVVACRVRCARAARRRARRPAGPERAMRISVAVPTPGSTYSSAGGAGRGQQQLPC